MKRKFTDLEKLFVISVIDKGVETQIYKEILCNKKKNFIIKNEQKYE